MHKYASYDVNLILSDALTHFRLTVSLSQQLSVLKSSKES